MARSTKKQDDDKPKAEETQPVASDMGRKATAEDRAAGAPMHFAPSGEARVLPTIAATLSRLESGDATGALEPLAAR